MFVHGASQSFCFKGQGDKKVGCYTLFVFAPSSCNNFLCGEENLFILWNKAWIIRQFTSFKSCHMIIYIVFYCFLRERNIYIYFSLWENNNYIFFHMVVRYCQNGTALLIKGTTQLPVFWQCWCTWRLPTEGWCLIHPLVQAVSIWQTLLPVSRKHLHQFHLLLLRISSEFVCVPQAATEDHGICRDAKRRGHQGCRPGLSKWVRQHTHGLARRETHTWFSSI